MDPKGKDSSVTNLPSHPTTDLLSQLLGLDRPDGTGRNFDKVFGERAK